MGPVCVGGGRRGGGSPLKGNVWPLSVNIGFLLLRSDDEKKVGGEVVDMPWALVYIYMLY